MPWGRTARTASPAGQGKWLSCSILLWHSSFLSIVYWALDASVSQKHQTIRVCPGEDDQDGKRPQGQDLWGTAEVTWFDQIEDEKAEGDLYTVYTFLKAGSRGRGVIFTLWWSVMGHKEMEWSFTRGRFFAERVVSPRTGSPGVARSLSEVKEHSVCFY